MDQNCQILGNALVQSTEDMTQEEQEFAIDYLAFALGYCASYLKAKINEDTECGECPEFEEMFPDYIDQLEENGKEVPATIREKGYIERISEKKVRHTSWKKLYIDPKSI